MEPDVAQSSLSAAARNQCLNANRRSRRPDSELYQSSMTATLPLFTQLALVTVHPVTRFLTLVCHTSQDVSMWLVEEHMPMVSYQLNTTNIRAETDVSLETPDSGFRLSVGPLLVTQLARIFSPSLAFRLWPDTPRHRFISPHILILMPPPVSDFGLTPLLPRIFARSSTTLASGVASTRWRTRPTRPTR